MATNPPLITIVGETASGKSALAMELAKKFDGEIICADSRTVYIGMDIGTAKPSSKDQQHVPHFGLNIATPDTPVTVADFKKLATEAIVEIGVRGHVPIMVGGSGLYIDAVLYDFEFRKVADPKLRAQLSKFSVPELQTQLQVAGLPLPANSQNPRHLVRALETGGQTPKRKALRPNTLIIGLRVPRDELRRRIEQRVEAMLALGLVDEIQRLGEAYEWSTPALQAPGYKAFHAYVAGESSLDQAKAEFIKNDMQLAKRQRTWFRRNSSIHWLEKTE
jgi:tRNA dimethylallyltransferase